MIVRAYHGTNRSFLQFALVHAGASVDAGTLGRGIYFTDLLQSAQSYAEWKVWKHGGTPVVLAATLILQRPYVVTRANQPRNLESDPKAAARFTRELQRQGYDGVEHHIDTTAVGGERFCELVVFDLRQIRDVEVLPWPPANG